MPRERKYIPAHERALIRRIKELELEKAALLNRMARMFSAMEMAHETLKMVEQREGMVVMQMRQVERVLHQTKLPPFTGKLQRFEDALNEERAHHRGQSLYVEDRRYAERSGPPDA